MTESAALSVLLVEDEPLIRMMVTDMLEELGHRVVAEAADVDTAAMLVRSTAFDLAILDINLDGVTSFPVAERDRRARDSAYLRHRLRLTFHGQ